MAVPISNVTRRAVYAPSGAGGVGPYAFTFEILANTDIAVFKDDVLLTLTTHYTVTINANGTGSVTITAAGLALSPVSPTQYAIVGNRTISRTTDFTTGGDFFANTINDELDQQTIFAQQNAEGLTRSLQAPQTDPTTIDMTLPRASVRANKTLAFDANGDPTTGEVIGDNRGNWASGVAYNKRDIVKDTSTGNVYYCNTSHTSSGSQPITTNADSAKWDLFVDNESAEAAQTAAEAAQTAAEAAQAAAETAETNAETAETNAETAATNAASSASAASTSASNASSSASSASSSASAASASASTASTQASNASTSATNASNSASSASTSATNAAASASTATTQASNASTSASNAASSASAASTSASNAATSATNASNSATTASTQASNAATSASNASTSATSAANSAAAAASALDSFDDRYLGTKTSDPTLDNDGNALVAGALYFSTTQNVMKVYDGASWITATSAGATSLLRFRYVATSGQTTFSGADSAAATLTYTVNNIAVHRNGVTLDTSEYTASNGTSIVLNVAAGTGDIVDIIAFKSFTVADALSAVSGGTVNGAVTITGVTTVQAGSASLPAITTAGDTNTGIFFPAADTIAFSEGGVESMRIDSSGNVGIGTSSPEAILTVSKSSAGGEGGYLYLDNPSASTANSKAGIKFSTSSGGSFASTPTGEITNVITDASSAASALTFGTFNGSSSGERARIDSSGNLLVGKTLDTLSTAGGYITRMGEAVFTVSANPVLYVNRLTDDGDLVRFFQATTQEGSISVSGTTVTYGGGHLARFGQLPNGSEEPTLLKGTVLTNLDEMCVWINKETGIPADNEQCNKVKISDVDGDANVAGVFVSWSYDEQHETNDLFVAMTGDMIIRIAQGVTIQRGDLLMSAGDGTAKPQGDDIVRSKTIAKVTSTHVTCTYADGSFCVPCVLMAC